MDFVPKNKILQMRPDSFIEIRKEFDLDKPGRMKEAVRLLHEWVQKQAHFKKKDFDPFYLETTILGSKGSLERAKTQLDKLCTIRTLLPQFFGNFNVKTDCEVLNKVVHTVMLPKLTHDHYRVAVSKFYNVPFESSDILSFYRYNVVLANYLKAHDYLKGFILISDFSEGNIMEIIAKTNPIEMRHAFSVYLEGYGMLIKGIHVISSSKFVDAMVTILKQVLSEKVGSRISVHKSVEDIQKVLSKDVLPKDYGGEEKSIKELSEEWIDVLSSKEHMDYVAEMNKAGTDESYRQINKFTDEYAGMPGSFRLLSVD